MIVGPVFFREATTAPRRVRFHAVPAIGVAALLSLLWIAWQIVGDSQPIDSPEIAARFGSEAFLLLAPLVLGVATLFAALVTAAAVSQEKDRKTLVLLLLTRMTNHELVLGRLAASLLEIVLAISACAPLFFLMTLFGGISFMQVLRVLAITFASALVAGSIGSTLALWRETTFQALALTTLALVAWLAAGEFVANGSLGNTIGGYDSQSVATIISPWRAVVNASEPELPPVAGMTNNMGQLSGPSVVAGFLTVAATMFVVINGVAILLVRVWNPSRATRGRTVEDEDSHSIYESELATDTDAAIAARAEAHRAPGKLRHVWNNPVLWREMRTWAYGKKVIVIRLVYLAAAIVSGYTLFSVMDSQAALALSARVPSATGPLLPLFVVSIVLLNALAVTSLTTERDGKSLDLLLVTDLTPKEIVLGKLFGALYNAKEMLLAPVVLIGILGVTGYATIEQTVFALLALLVSYGFAVMLGVRSGMIYANSRHAVATSIGTLLFLVMGIAICMRMMLALESFDYQFGPFLAFIFGGGLLLWTALGGSEPSNAISVVAFVAPLATFFIIVSFLQGDYGPATLVTVVTYGFAVAAMLIPAIAEFDVTTGRTSDRPD